MGVLEILMSAANELGVKMSILFSSCMMVIEIEMIGCVF